MRNGGEDKKKYLLNSQHIPSPIWGPFTYGISLHPQSTPNLILLLPLHGWGHTTVKPLARPHKSQSQNSNSDLPDFMPISFKFTRQKNVKMNRASPNLSLLLVTFQKTNLHLSSSNYNKFPKIPVYSKDFQGGVIMPQVTLSIFRDTNDCHKEKELLASGAEARDAVKCPTKHTTAPATMIIQPKCQ